MPGNRCTTLHGYGNASSGSLTAIGNGTARGNCGAKIGSHCRSLATLSIAQWILGSRAAMSSPSRYVALSVPADGTRTIGSSAHCGCCETSKRRTNAASVSTSSSCILGCDIARSLTALSANRAVFLWDTAPAFVRGDVGCQSDQKTSAFATTPATIVRLMRFHRRSARRAYDSPSRLAIRTANPPSSMRAKASRSSVPINVAANARAVAPTRRLARGPGAPNRGIDPTISVCPPRHRDASAHRQSCAYGCNTSKGH